jgi:hypothetical protein
MLLLRLTVSRFALLFNFGETHLQQARIQIAFESVQQNYVVPQ